MAFSGLKNLFGHKSAPKKEATFENCETAEDFKFLKIIDLQHLGIPSNSTSTLTFDKIQGLLALGTMDGSLKIFGKQGIEIMLIGQDSSPIELLEFITNKGYLLSYSCLKSSLTLWSLQTLSSDSIPVSFQVSRIVYDHGNYIFIGTTQGSLRTFNIVEKRLTCFELKPSTLQIPSSALIDIAQNPIFSSKLALAYESGTLLIWDLSATKLLHKLQSDSPIHICAWSPDGNSLAIGRRDGSILIYQINKTAKVHKSFRPDLNAQDLNVEAIRQIYWTESGMVVFGGMPFGNTQQINLISGQELNEVKQVKVPERFVPMQMIFTPLVEKSETFVIMSEDEVLSFSLQDCELEYITELYGGSEVICSFYSSLCDGENLEEIIRNVSAACQSHLLSGGEVLESEVYGLLFTGHTEGIIRIWSVTSNRICNLINLCLLTADRTCFKTNTIFFDVSDVNPCKVSCLLLDKGRLFAGFDLGKIAIWELGESVRLMNVFKYHKVPILNVRVNEKFIVTGDMEGNVTFFDTETNDVIVEEAKPGQILSITFLAVIYKVVYICYSNGTVRAFNPFALQFLPEPKLARTDLKSEVPKRSEFGVLKILFTSLHPQFAVLCYEKSMALTSLSDFSIKSTQNWTSPMISCNLSHIRSDVFIYILHSDCIISMLEFHSLKRVWKSMIPSPLQYFLHSSGFYDFHMALDGHFIITTSRKNLISGWVTMHDEDPPCKLSLWKPIPEKEKTDKKSKSFLGIKYSSEINYSTLFEKPNSKFQADDEESDEAEEVKVESVHAEVGQAKSAISEALQKVSERGDKIKSLEEKMKEMSEKSRNFAQMAAEIAKKEKNKKWWQV